MNGGKRSDGEGVGNSGGGAGGAGGGSTRGGDATGSGRTATWWKEVGCVFVYLQRENGSFDDEAIRIWPPEEVSVMV